MLASRATRVTAATSGRPVRAQKICRPALELGCPVHDRAHASVQAHRVPKTSRRGDLRCRSAADGATPPAARAGSIATLSVSSITKALMRAQKAWEAHKTSGSGKVRIEEAVELLNSKELNDAAFELTGLKTSHPRTTDDIKQAFSKADWDKSGDLGKREFMCLWLSIALAKVKKNPLVVIEALLLFIDADKNGKIDGKEMRLLLDMVGAPGLLVKAVPEGAAIDYMTMLRKLGGGKSAAAA